MTPGESTGPARTGRLTASVVGAGTGGWLSIDALATLNEYQLVSVADIRPDARKAVATRFPGIRTFEHAADMFSECPADVICVSTYASTHEQIALQAVETPVRGLLLEKPLSHDAAGARRLLGAVKMLGLPVVVPHGLLTRGTPLEVKRRLQAGDIGQIRMVGIESRGWDLINAGIHWLHYTLSVLDGEEVSDVLAAVDSTTRTYRDGLQVETESAVLARTTAGTRILVNSGDYLPTSHARKEAVFRFVGTGGVAEFCGWDPGFQMISASAGDEHPGLPPEPALIGHARYLHDLAGMIATGARDYAGAERSVAALEVCEAAYLSARLGCNVTLPLSEFVAPEPSGWQPGSPYDGQGGGRDGRQLNWRTTANE